MLCANKNCVFIRNKKTKNFLVQVVVSPPGIAITIISGEDGIVGSMKDVVVAVMIVVSVAEEEEDDSMFARILRMC